MSQYFKTKVHPSNGHICHGGLRVCACACGLFLFRRSQEDLRALMDAYMCIASLCHNQTKALQDLAGEAALIDKTVPLVQSLYALTLF